jgi:hypothetical protein
MLYRGNMSRPARYAGVDIKDFHEKMARYGSNGKGFKYDSPVDRNAVDRGRERM